ncbi:MAG: anthranilate synthase component I [Fimbriimonadia bacterium]|nr:anthranilate synthase component I [Fimbriimonadia bacterium]
MISPTKETFIQRARLGWMQPVYFDALADWETPVSAFYKMARDSDYAFLLESVSGGERVARYSFLGVEPEIVVSGRGKQARIQERGTERVISLSESASPLEPIRALLRKHRWFGGAHLPRFAGGAVGFLSYDFARALERLPDSTENDLKMDDYRFMFPGLILVFDHVLHKIRLLTNVAPSADPEADYDRAIARLEAARERLLTPLPPPANYTDPTYQLNLEQNISRESYEAAVARAKEYIHAGDCVQVVLSQRLSAPFHAPPLNLYRALRSLNPSPYMFYLKMKDLSLIGASPEILVSLEGRKAIVRPIAGTRPRGTTEEEDKRLETELMQDEKERAEHIMLVDLGRNDLGRVCDYGSVKVHDLMTIERYSHVMHIVSEARGQLKPNLDALDLLSACFPAGTVSGAPKVRAMEIIDELETTRRGAYAGGVGHLSFSGDMDMCITLRAILLKDGVAYVQAGAGIVADSDPATEYQECLNKAAAALKAIEQAHRGLE